MINIDSGIKEMIVQGDITTLYKHSLILLEEDPRIKPTVDKAKNGINIPFDLRFTPRFRPRGEGRYWMEKIKMGKIFINNGSKRFIRIGIKEYEDEIENREKLLRILLMDHYGVTDMPTSREYA